MMVCIPASQFTPPEMKFWFANQRLYTPEQKQLAREHPHLFWVSPPYKGLPKKLRMEVFARDEGVCRYCLAVLTFEAFTVDHIVARVNGGTDDLDNLTGACRPCNSSKKDRPYYG